MARFMFSNFHPAPITLDRIEYATAEAAYQALKTDDRGWRLQVAACASPGAAKRVGRKVPMTPGFDRLAAMERVLRTKFAPGTDWAATLVDSGAEELIEWNTWHDRFWGRCTCHRCAGFGENHLGRLLMRLRAELVEQAAAARLVGSPGSGT